MSFYHPQAGRSPFADVRRPVEGSSDRMFYQWYNGAYLQAMRLSPQVQGVTIGPNAPVMCYGSHVNFPYSVRSSTPPGFPIQASTPLKNLPAAPIPTAIIPPTSATSLAQPTAVQNPMQMLKTQPPTKIQPSLAQPPAARNNLQIRPPHATKISPNSSEPDTRKSATVSGADDPHPFKIDPRIHKLTDFLPRRPKHAAGSLTLTAKEVKSKVVESQLMKKEVCTKMASSLEAKALNTQSEFEANLAKQYAAAQKVRLKKEDALEQALLKLMMKSPQKEVEDVSEAQEKIEQRKKERQKKFHELVVLCHNEYAKKYDKLKAIILSCKDTTKLQSRILEQLNQIRINVRILESHVNKDKTGSLSQADVEECRAMIESIEVISEVVATEVGKINAWDKEEKERIASEAKKAEEAKKAAEEKEAKEREEQEELDELSVCCDTVFLPFYFDLRERYAKVQTILEPLISDKNYEKFRFELHKSTTTAVNAISRVSAKHMLDKYLQLRNLLMGHRAEARSVSINDHVLGPIYLRNVLAKLFVRQGDVAVSSRPDAAFEIASILVNLMVDFPDFGQLVHAHFLVACPYLAPMFWPPVEGQLTHDYYRSLGYLVQNGEVERQDLFLKRMKGIMRLYAAILITPTRSGAPNPLGIREAWRWLAAFCNLPPRPDISAVLVLELLEVAGHDMLQVYGMPAKKLLALVCKEYYPRLAAATANGNKGALTRLGSFLKKAMEEGTIPSPPQRLPAKFW